MRERIGRVGLFLFYTLLLLLALGACGEQEVTVEIEADATELAPGGRIILEAEIVSPSPVKGPIVYKWSATAGELSKTDTPTVQFTAPAEPGDVAVTVEVTIGQVTYPITRKFQVLEPATAIAEAPSGTPAETPTTAPGVTLTEAPAETPAVAVIETPTKAPTKSPTPTSTPPPLECRHPELTAYVFPQLQDVPGQRAFYGPWEETEEVFECRGVYDTVRSEPVAVRIEYHVVRGSYRHGYFGIGTLGGYDATAFSQICLWAYAEQPDQAFRVKLKDTSEAEAGVNVTVREPNKWSQICVDLAEFSDQGVKLDQLDNVNLGFEEANGNATIWVDDFEFTK